MNETQQAALQALCDRYKVAFSAENFHAQFDLPAGYVAGWAGPIYVGCSPDGDISS